MSIEIILTFLVVVIEGKKIQEGILVSIVSEGDVKVTQLSVGDDIKGQEGSVNVVKPILEVGQGVGC